MTPAGLLVFCSLLTRTLCVIAPQIPEPYPIFEDEASTNNVTVQLGSRVHLHCRIHDLGEKTISWVRRRGDELHLLSFGRHTYSADSRYSLAFEHPNDWRLLIQYVSERDEGYYECQISTHPPLVRRVHLTSYLCHKFIQYVSERDEGYYECQISTHPPLVRRVHLTSYLCHKFIQYVSERDEEYYECQISTHPPLVRRVHLTSYLCHKFIQYVSERDEGYYECQISTHPPLVRRVHLTSYLCHKFIQYVSERDEEYYECQISTHPPLDKLYKEGSIIELRCVVSEVPQPGRARQVSWKHGARILNYDTKRGGVSVKTEVTLNGALSRLYIANANRHDSGNYTCSLADVATSAVSVHVLRGNYSRTTSARWET
ncbi:putative defective proboscis extension response [Operophtera brumata]|uniref:Putative defective proboscis extension response n=1 Tax=Operophtera brumata TaxID=104452 RepID=A0A0L7LP15_OPEBR|nr:putative defective proboscis extension response [Operophtera brumata]